MFIVSNRPDWTPGDLVAMIFETIKGAEKWVTQELNDRASDGISGSYYIRQVDLGDQLKYTSEIVVNINASAYPEEG